MRGKKVCVVSLDNVIPSQMQFHHSWTSHTRGVTCSYSCTHDVTLKLANGTPHLVLMWTSLVCGLYVGMSTRTCHDKSQPSEAAIVISFSLSTNSWLLWCWRMRRATMYEGLWLITIL